MRCALLVVGFGLIACKAASESRELDHDLIEVSSDARLRTDTVGGGKFEDQATFVLVDAENHGTEGAYVTLDGDLATKDGTVVGGLRAQSLWIPSGERRTFALVDRERKPRLTAAAASIHVRGASIPKSPPSVHVDQIHELVDQGRIVVQGTLHNDAARAGQIMVIATFYDDTHHPMTRPFSMVRVEANAQTAVQFVGPPDSKHATIFTGDAAY